MNKGILWHESYFGILENFKNSILQFGYKGAFKKQDYSVIVSCAQIRKSNDWIENFIGSFSIVNVATIEILLLT